MKFRFTPRISFQVKVLVPVLAVMALLMAATIWMVNRRITDQMHENAARQLDTAANIFTQIHEHQTQHLIALHESIKNEPRFKAVTSSAALNSAVSQDDGGVSERTVAQVITDYMSQLVTNKQVSIASFTWVRDPEHPLFPSPGFDADTNEFRAQSAEAIRQAVKGETKVDTIRVGTNLFDIVSVPIGNDEVTSVLTFGLRLDNEQALQTKQIAHSDMLFLADGHVAASSLSKSASFASLNARFNSLSSPGASQAAADPYLSPDNEHFLCRAGHFPSLSGDKSVGYLLLSSYEDSWTAMKVMREKLLVAGLFGICISGLIVWILIRRITQPLRKLRDTAEAVGRGDFSHRVEVTSKDECGELATSFNRMTENVKTSREELEKTVETLKTTQHQLIQSEKLAGIGEFVAGVAHELNNPLTSVMGFSELLQQSDLPEQQRRYLDVIFKSAKRCQKVVQSLLSFARRHAPERKIVVVNEIVESALEIMQYQMRTSNIEVVTQFAPNLPLTELDPHQMQQVFLNIINNARQAMEGRSVKGRLRVVTEPADKFVRIIFEDNGPGITPENLKRIFNPFFTTKEVGKGTGLGLSLCYGIISEHGGTIMPYSTFGQGATFVIELPVTQNAAQPAQKKGPASTEVSNDGAGKRVLVVDDEDMILQMIREALTRHGYKVDIAHDGEAALRRLGQYHYDLALCDWKMPGLNGEQLYEKLAESNPEMSKRLIFITGDVVNEKVQEFLRARNKVCISKPFTLVEFRSAISQVLKSN